jgi:hypothetical protein
MFKLQSLLLRNFLWSLRNGEEFKLQSWLQSNSLWSVSVHFEDSFLRGNSSNDYNRVFPQECKQCLRKWTKLTGHKAQINSISFSVTFG